MNNAPAKKPIGLYIGLAVVVIFVIAGIAFVIFINNFLKSPQGKKMMSGIMTTERVENLVPDLNAALSAYVKAKGDYPADIDDLSKFGLSDEKVATTKELLKYTKPAKDAPPETVILDSGKMEFIKGADMRIQVTKNGDAYQMTRTPLGRRAEVTVN